MRYRRLGDFARFVGENSTVGERNPRAKNSDAEIAEIRRRVGDGETRTAVAKSYGLHLSTVSKICSGQRRTPQISQELKP